MRPTEPSALDDRPAPAAHSSSRVGGGVSAPASRSAVERRVRGTRVARRAARRWPRSRRARRGRQGRSRRPALPRDGSSDSRPGSAWASRRAAGQVRVLARAPSRPAAGSARRSPARSRVARPTPMPSWASTIPPCVSFAGGRASRAASSPRQSCVSASHPTISSCRARGDVAREVRQLPPRNPPPRRGGCRCGRARRAPCRGRAPPPRAWTAGAAGARTRAPPPRALGRRTRSSRSGCSSTRSPEHEERGLHFRRLERLEHRRRPPRVRPVVERERKHPSDTTRGTARLRVAWWA